MNKKIYIKLKMKAMIYFLICIYIIKLTLEECFTVEPSSTEECENKKTSGNKCCYVEFRTNRDPEYKTLCVEVTNADIKDGHHEATITLIETGNYTGSNWNQSILERFRNYSSIDKFDCKGNYISKSLFMLSIFLILFLI